MKIFKFLLTFSTVLFFGTVAQAQVNREITYDTVYFQRLPGSTGDTIFFEVRTIIYSDLSEETRKQPIGDSATAVNYVAGFAVDQTRRLAANATPVIRKSQTIQPISTLWAAAATAGLGDIGKAVQDFFAPNLVGDYVVKVTGKADYSGTIVLNAQGVLRATLADGITRNVTVFSDALIRVANYPAGTFTDLFKTGENVYQSIDKALVLRKKAASAQNK